MLFTDVELWPKQLFVLNGYLTWCFLLLLFIIFNFGCRMSCKHCYWSTIIFWGWYFHWVCLAVDIFVNSFHCIVSVFIGQRDVWYGPDSSYGQHCSRWRECSSLLHLSKTRHKLLHDVRQISPNMLSQRICMCPNWELNLDQIFFFFPHSGCDNCNEWFHGHCINVTEKMAKAIREWYCQQCQSQWLMT